MAAHQSPRVSAPKRPAEGLRIAVLSDIHANAPALKVAMAEVKRRGFDRLVVLGDLLTYGCAPLEVLELLQEAAKSGAVFIKGNHDQLYIDLVRGDRSYFEQLPAWMQEAAAWTHDNLRGRDVEKLFPWQNSVLIGDLFFAHANPFLYGDWTYLNRSEDIERAARRLKGRGFQFGVFGHTHRSKIALMNAEGSSRIFPVVMDQPEHRFRLRRDIPAAIIDVGSIGQPRSQDRSSRIAIVTSGKEAIEVEYVRLAYDVEAHRQGIADSSLSDRVKEKLLGFFD